jgi:hypothetical protein
LRIAPRCAWLALATLAACGRQHASPQQAASSGHAPDLCRADSAVAPLISAESIGVLDLRKTVSQLRATCPSGVPTVVYGQENIDPAIEFRVGGVNVVAFQNRAAPDTLAPSEHFAFWTVHGSRARLPGGLTLASQFGRLRAAFGRGAAFQGPPVAVEFCSLPLIQFYLHGYAAPSEMRVTDDLSFIPDSASIDSVVVFSGPGAGDYSLCQKANG